MTAQKKMRLLCADNQIIEVDVHAEFGLMSVTDSTVSATDAYTVTHKVLGVKIRNFLKLEDAIAAAKHWSIFSWEIDLKDKEKIAELRTALEATKEWDKGFK